MNITIENFKGIRNGSYSFTPNSTTLISGPSGIGKSSILEAISYVICNDNSRGLANVGSNGKIMVKLEITEKMTIVRTNKPKKVEVTIKNSEGIEKVYEDDLAQSYINNYFTMFFKDVGYLRQKGASSFLQKTCTEKMDFLRLWITNDATIASVKNRLKEYTKKIKDKIDQTNIDIQVAKQLFLKIEEPITIENPIPSVYNYNNFQKYKNTQLNIYQTHYSKNYSTLKNFNNILKNEKLILRKLELKKLCSNHNLQELQQKSKILHELEYFLSSQVTKGNGEISDSNGEKSDDELKSELQKLKQFQFLTNRIYDLNQVIKYKNNIIDSISTIYFEKKDLQKTYLKNIEECEHIHKFSEIYQRLITDMNRTIRVLSHIKGVNIVDKYILEFTTEFFDQLSLNIVCPNCNCGLHIVDSDELHIHITSGSETSSNETSGNDVSENPSKMSNDVKQIYINYNRLYSELKPILDQFDESVLQKNIKGELTLLNQQLHSVNHEISLIEALNIPLNNEEKKNINGHKTLNQLIQQLKKIENSEIELQKIYDENGYTSIINFNDEIEKIENILQERKELTELTNNIDRLHNKLDKKYDHKSVKIELEYISHLIESINEYNTLQKINETSLNETSGSENPHGNESVDFDRIRENVNILKIECKILTNIIQNIFEFKDNVKQYINYVNKKEEYIKLKNNLEFLENRFDKLKNKYDRSILLKSIIEKTESRMIDMFIYELNDKFQHYIDQFFIDDTMTIDLRCIKTKKEQPKLTFNINYKGNLIDDVKNLSGGESDRVQLAISLSFCDILKLPLIMIDETLSSLDETSCLNVLENIKDGNRTTLVVSHQIQEGIFDNTLKIK